MGRLRFHAGRRFSAGNIVLVGDSRPGSWSRRPDHPITAELNDDTVWQLVVEDATIKATTIADKLNDDLEQQLGEGEDLITAELNQDPDRQLVVEDGPVERPGGDGDEHPGPRGWGPAPQKD